jgi:solute carrier family 34 (sodium-dependent phosphate cotransporter)
MSRTTSDSAAPGEAPDAPVRGPRPTAQARVAGGAVWLARFLLALFLFVGALQVMKTGAGKFEALHHGGFLVRNAFSTLGLGWLGALLVLSGSPIAASALSLVSARSIDVTEGFTMLTGSRLGAAFVVLLVAVIYALRGGEGRRMAPVSTAVMALTATAFIYAPAALLGYGLLHWEPFRAVNIQFPAQFSDLLDIVYGDLLAAIEGWPAAVLFLGGLGILLVAFKLIDTVVPEIGREEIERSRLSWMTSKWPMFGLGCLVALIAMSVSVALTVLVPLVAKGYVKREDILPYIIGANITTLGDTLLAAFLLDSPAAVQIVLAGIIATTVVSLVLLAFFYPQLKRGVWRFQRQMVMSKTRLFAFTSCLFVVPIATIGIAGVVG